MTTWILIIYIYAGMMANGDSVAIINIPSFASEHACKSAGEQTKKFVSGSAKELRYVCVKS